MVVKLLFLCFLRLLGNEVVPVVSRKPSRGLIGMRGWRGKRGKGDLGDFHPRSQNDWHIALIRYFKRNMQEMPRINDARGVVHHEPDACER